MVYINVVDVLCFTELCYTTTVPECLAVNQTHFLLPNAFGDMTLSAAVERFGYYKNESCSAKFMLYLCNMFFPTCNTSTGMMQFPCKSLCNGMHVHIKNNNFSHREYSMELLYQVTVLVKEIDIRMVFLQLTDKKSWWTERCLRIVCIGLIIILYIYRGKYGMSGYDAIRSFLLQQSPCDRLCRRRYTQYHIIIFIIGIPWHSFKWILQNTRFQEEFFFKDSSFMHAVFILLLW